MPFKKLELKPGINKEATRYSSEGGWYDCDKVRFRQNFPEKIGGWSRISGNTFVGICRSIVLAYFSGAETNRYWHQQEILFGAGGCLL